MTEANQVIEKTGDTFIGENVEVSVFRKPKCRVEYLVKASSSLVRDAKKEAIKQVTKQVSLPGFRKGKAPEALVTKKFAADIDKKWQEEIANIAFKESAKLTAARVLSGNAQITFHMKNHSLDNGAELTLTFEVEPEIPHIDPKLLRLTEIERPAVDEKKYEETIDQIRRFFAKWDKITDRPVREGDFIIVDLEDLEQSPPQKIFSHTRLSVEKEKMAAWMYELVLGKEVGQSYEGISEPDATLSEEEKKEYPSKRVRVTIHEITSPILPDVDDQFALRLGVPNTSEMKTNIFKQLEAQADAFVADKLREQVSAALLTTFPFDLPDSLTEREAQFRLRELSNDENFKQYWASLPEAERRSTIRQVYEQSEKAVRLFYLCRKVIDENGLTVSPEDLPSAPNTPLEALFTPQNRRGQHAQDPQTAEAYSRMIMEKAERFLAKGATLVPAEEKEAPKELPAPEAEAPAKKKAAPKEKAAPAAEADAEAAPKKKAPRKEKTEGEEAAPAPKKKSPAAKKVENA